MASLMAANSRTRRLSIMLVAILVVALLFGGAPQQAAAQEKGHGKGPKGNVGDLVQQIEELQSIVTQLLSFLDLDEAPWAKHYILKWQLKGILKGMEPGKFRPKHHVTRAQAVTIGVRFLGYEEEAQELMDADLPYEDLKRNASWAVGYVAKALELGLIEAGGSTFQPNKPADRAWAAMLLVRVLDQTMEEDLEAMAQANMDTVLDFKDDKAIPDWARGYVAVAVEKGMIEGFENGTFRPNTPLNRAQIAAILDRAAEQAPEEDENEIEGTVVSVDGLDGDAPSITISTGEGQVTVNVAAGAPVFVDGEEATLGDIVVGDEVEVQLDAEGIAVLIRVEIPRDEVKGTVVSVDAESITISREEGDDEDTVSDEVTYVLASEISVTYEGETVTLSDVLAGDEVELKLVRGKVTEIKIEEREELKVEGTVTAIGLSEAGDPVSITIQVADGDDEDDAPGEVTYNVAADVAVTLDGEEIAFADILIADVVELKGEGDLVTEIKIEEREEVKLEGTVIAIDTEEPFSITIQVGEGEDIEEVTYEVAADVSVTLDGVEITFGEILVGDTVELEGEGNLVTKIKVET